MINPCIHYTRYNKSTGTHTYTPLLHQRYKTPKAPQEDKEVFFTNDSNTTPNLQLFVSSYNACPFIYLYYKKNPVYAPNHYLDPK